ncbi:Sterol carrier protein 2 (SCP-2) (Acetyl-CoA C-myristoyltransferase) (Non-specific lipid-transfer protein) (NSL-TP) (Propanoyl-CoA C-acyltransferase) (SCP-2/3-oxoacyl-CoA thiolase) (SCP-2/thiolase) (SCP-chi) (Sterol carrier protein X) (SCP-X) (Straight-chain acyl-CoA oxidase) (SCPX), partial [Durusdinium trenchii]
PDGPTGPIIFGSRSGKQQDKPNERAGGIGRMGKFQKRRVFVVGVGMTKLTKPKKDESEGPHFPELGQTAVERALEDACLSDKRHLIESAHVGCMFNVGAGQRVLYGLPGGPIMGIPISNLNNACATGSHAFALARQSVMSGVNDCALALGVEKMKPGSLGGGGGGGPSSIDNHFKVMVESQGMPKTIPMAAFFGGAGLQHNKLYGSTPEHFAKIGEKNHRHSVNNPYAQFRDEYTLEEIKASPAVFPLGDGGALTKLQCSPTSDGAAAVIVASEEFVIEHGLQGQAVEILGQGLRTDSPTVFDAPDKRRSMIEVVGFGMASEAAAMAYKEAGITPDQVDVVELHDCFSCNELLTYEALGLAKVGEGHKLVDSGDNTFGGKYVINPSGGLISKGHPLGCTGASHVAEICWQLRGECGPRQVQDAKIGMNHNLGLGGLVCVNIFKRPDEWRSIPMKRKQSLAMGPPPSAKL